MSKSSSFIFLVALVAFGSQLERASAGNCKDNVDGFPKESYKEFLNIAAAAYKSAPINYLSQYSSINWGLCGTTEKTSSKWGATCLLDKTNKRFYITFRGVQDWQWGSCGAGGAVGLAGCSAGFVATAEKDSTVRSFKDWVKGKWQAQQPNGYKFYALVGHSMGGYFATRVLKGKGYAIWRVTFNGWKATASQYTLNLRAKNDGLSGHKDCRYFKVNGVSGHGLSKFFDQNHKSWKVILDHSDWSQESLPADNTPEDRDVVWAQAKKTELFVDEDLAEVGSGETNRSYLVLKIIFVLLGLAVFVQLRRSKQFALKDGDYKDLDSLQEINEDTPVAVV